MQVLVMWDDLVDRNVITNFSVRSDGNIQIGLFTPSPRHGLDVNNDVNIITKFPKISCRDVALKSCNETAIRGS